MAAALSIAPTEAFVSQPVAITATGFAASSPVTVRVDELGIAFTLDSDLSGDIDASGMQLSFPHDGMFTLRASDGTTEKIVPVRVWSR